MIRVLRPLRAVQRFPELKRIINAILHAMPMLANVFVLLLGFFILFGLLGLQLFGGILRDASGENPNFGYTHFDDIVGSAFTLFLLITLEGWGDTMGLVEDATGNPWGTLYSWLFI